MAGSTLPFHEQRDTHSDEEQAHQCVCELRIDDALVTQGNSSAEPWLLCYRAMHHRIVDAAYADALSLAEQACALFAAVADQDGYARARAEAAITRYHLGQYEQALINLAACPPPNDSICAAALALAAFLNHIGQGELDASIAAAEHGLLVLDDVDNDHRRMPWQIVLQRNLAAAYHFAGNLRAARQSAEAALALAEAHAPHSYTLHWAL